MGSACHCSGPAISAEPLLVLTIGYGGRPVVYSVMKSLVLIDTRGSAISVPIPQMVISPGTWVGTRAKNMRRTWRGGSSRHSVVYLTSEVPKPKGGRAIGIPMLLYFYYSNAAGRKSNIHTDILAPRQGMNDLPMYAHQGSAQTLKGRMVTRSRHSSE